MNMITESIETYKPIHHVYYDTWYYDNKIATNSKSVESQRVLVEQTMWWPNVAIMHYYNS